MRQMRYIFEILPFGLILGFVFKLSDSLLESLKKILPHRSDASSTNACSINLHYFITVGVLSRIIFFSTVIFLVCRSLRSIFLE